MKLCILFLRYVAKNVDLLQNKKMSLFLRQTPQNYQTTPKFCIPLLRQILQHMKNIYMNNFVFCSYGK